MRESVEVTVGSITEMEYAAYQRGRPNFTILSVVSVDPLPGSILLEMEPALNFAMIDRFAGGPGKTLRTMREHPAIEMTLLQITALRILGNLREVWTRLYIRSYISLVFRSAE